MLCYAMRDCCLGTQTILKKKMGKNLTSLDYEYMFHHKCFTIIGHLKKTLNHDSVYFWAESELLVGRPACVRNICCLFTSLISFCFFLFVFIGLIYIEPTQLCTSFPLFLFSLFYLFTLSPRPYIRFSLFLSLVRSLFFFFKLHD